jgi:hypothetical protein
MTGHPEMDVDLIIKRIYDSRLEYINRYDRIPLRISVTAEEYACLQEDLRARYKRLRMPIPSLDDICVFGMLVEVTD